MKSINLGALGNVAAKEFAEAAGTAFEKL